MIRPTVELQPAEQGPRLIAGRRIRCLCHFFQRGDCGGPVLLLHVGQSQEIMAFHGERAVGDALGRFNGLDGIAGG